MVEEIYENILTGNLFKDVSTLFAERKKHLKQIELLTNALTEYAEMTTIGCSLAKKTLKEVNRDN